MNSQMLTKFEIQKRLALSYSPQGPPESPYPESSQDGNPLPAAVLIPLLEMEDGWHLLFIRRTVVLHDQHSGQVAFPGGRCDPDDQTAENTAIRESKEEVGINPRDVQIIGRVREMLTITNYIVTPIVGVIPWPYDFNPQEDEVARIFSIPLNWLVNPGHRYIQMRGQQIIGCEVPVIYFHKFDGELLWGASARITVLLLEALGLSVPEKRYS